MNSLLAIGEYVDGKDVTDDCIKQKIIFLGFEEHEAPDYHDLFETIPAATPFFIKSRSIQEGLYVKAVGITTSSKTLTIMHNGRKRKAKEVRFIWTGNEFIGKLNDKLDAIRGVTMYYEPNQKLIERILNLT